MRTKLATIAATALCACSSAAPVQYQATRTGAPVTAEPDLPAETPIQGPYRPNANLFACNMQMSNRPQTATNRMVIGYSPLIVVNGIVLASSPANDVCLTSGFGPRSGRMHKGIDLQARPAVPIYSAGPGRVLEVSYQSGFGNQVLIGHGNGVYTRYAHLAHFTPGLAAGQVIGFGQPLGMMGASGNATAVHVHYEILTGNYNTPKKSWGLDAHNPLDFPAWAGLDGAS